MCRNCSREFLGSTIYALTDISHARSSRETFTGARTQNLRYINNTQTAEEFFYAQNGSQPEARTTYDYG